MAQGGDFGVGRIVAALAIVVSVPTSLRTRRRLRFMMLQIVAQRSSLADLRVTATGADPGITALFRTSRFCGHCPFSPVVTKGVGFLCFPA